MNDNDYACMLQFFTERNLFYPAGAQWVSKTIMNPGRDPHSNSVLLPVRFRPAGHLQISGSDTFTTYLSPLHPSTYLILQVFLTDDGTNKRGGHIPTLRNMVPSSILLYVSDHPLRSNVEASCLSAVNHIICLRFLRLHVQLHFLEI